MNNNKDTIRLLNTAFLFAAIATLVLAFVRGQSNMLLSIIDIIIGIFCLFLLFYLKTHHHQVNKIAWVAIFLLYILFVMVYLLAPEITVRASLFILLLAAIFFIKGRKIAFYWLFVIFATLFIPKLFDGFELNYSYNDLFTLSSYLLGFYLVMFNFDQVREQHTTELIRLNKQLNQELKVKDTKLSIANEALQHDQVSQLMTRSKFINIASFEVDQASRHAFQLSLVIIDINGFTQINKTHTQVVGDKILLELAKTLQVSAKKSDVLVRWDKDVFIILLPKSNIESATILANTIQRNVISNKKLKPFDINVSMGVVSLHKNESLISFIKNAESQLGTAKKDKLNNISVQA